MSCRFTNRSLDLQAVLSDTKQVVRPKFMLHFGGAVLEVDVPAEEPERLSQMQTLWTLLGQAHQGPEELGRQARAALLERYGGAVRRYLLGALRDPEAADELAQEFALKFLRGELRNADPERGRFRSFLKTVLVRLVIDFHRRRKHQPLGLNSQSPEPVAPDGSPFDSDAMFLQSWRNELLARGWAALEQFEKSANQPFYTVLRFRADHADLSSAQMAERLSPELGKQVSAANVRQLLHRSREKFAELLVEEVSQSLEQSTSLVDELIELSLLEYCRPELERRNLA